MRARLMLLPLLVCASPALAQPRSPEPAVQLPPELSDPAFAARMNRVMQALSKVFLDLKVGEVQAAVEGRQPTAAEKRMTVRDVGKIDGKDFERRMAEVQPKVEQSMKALQQALPEMMRSLGQVQKSLERATANMPDPTYPKR